MNKQLLSLLLLVLLSVPALANQPGTSEGAVKVNYGSVTTSGIKATIDASTGAVAKAAGSAATTLDAIRIYQSEQHSVAAAVTATQAVALTITAYGSIDGTNRTTFSPAVTVPLAFSATTKRLMAPLSLPVTPYVILTIGSDATYPVTYTAVTLQSW